MVIGKLANLTMISVMHLVFLPTSPVQVLGHLEWDMQGGSTPHIVIGFFFLIIMYFLLYKKKTKIPKESNLLHLHGLKWN